MSRNQAKWAMRVGAVALVAMAALAQDDTKPRVRITGGVDDTLQNYEWTVFNEYDSPIVWIQFPHERADLFRTPEGWDQKTTHLVNVGVPDVPGTCTALVESPSDGIAPNRSAQFGMRIATLGARPEPGVVRVRFADGEEISVGGVEVPTKPEEVNSAYYTLGFAVIFVIVVGVGIYRQQRRRKRAGSQDREPAQPD